ncbi:hypothetical protein N3K66_000139 [Trichothecium roseum]|uniref:Uncharacterized protein n=1 Tax=Trichothecium roseum TaxID=47278 RepID=A0ACC0VB09_9HYPO|nr:hypothetical protein N3K66_000139 [Trichothecium roseum]
MRPQSLFSRHRARPPLLPFLVATSLFLIASAYLCATRLSNMSFNHESPSSPDAKTITTDNDNNDAVATETGPGFNLADLPMSYTGNRNHPPTDKPVHLLANLPPSLVPTPANGRRLIIIGDIHGMLKPLEHLLHKVSFSAETDHVVAVGDMINKGPDSPGVVSHLMSIGASAVRGNHEDRVLLAKKELDSRRRRHGGGRHGRGAVAAGGGSAGVDASAELAADTPGYDEARGNSKDMAVAKSLSKEQLDWVAGLPLILTAQPLPIVVVHAGLVPNLPLREQDPWAVMNVRTLVYPREALRHQDGHARSPEDSAGLADHASVPGSEAEAASDDSDEDADVDRSAIPHDKAVFLPIDTHEGEKWSKVWNKYQKRLRKSDRRTVVYGHDAKVGYSKGKYTFGLDSDCSRGGALTALVVTGKEGGGFNWDTKHVKCKKAS